MDVKLGVTYNFFLSGSDPYIFKIPDPALEKVVILNGGDLGSSTEGKR